MQLAQGDRDYSTMSTVKFYSIGGNSMKWDKEVTLALIALTSTAITVGVPAIKEVAIQHIAAKKEIALAKAKAESNIA